MKMNVNKNDWIDGVALTAIGAYMVGCACIGSDFSELHLTLSFLSFPIFLGELLIAFCLLCLYIKHISHPIEWTLWQKRLWMFIACIVVYALYDFCHWGPLAFRNAAMYYYVIFLLFGYVFYNPRVIGASIPFVIPILIYLTSIFHDANYFWLTAVVMFILTMRFIPSLPARLISIAIFLLLCNYHLLFAGSRTNLLSALMALSFLAYVYLKHFSPMTKTKKIAITGMIIAALLLGLFLFADRNGIKSIVEYKELKSIYIENKKDIKRLDKFYVPIDFKPALYHENHEKPVVAATVGVSTKESIQPATKETPSPAQGGASPLATDSSVKQSWEDRIIKQPASRSLTHAQYNMIFRVFIWEDMFNDFYHSPLLLGVGLGRPQRSHSLEVLKWGQEEWHRDGWITPHNSYFHVVYRLGIVGILLIVVLALSLYHLYRQFVELKSFVGILLVGILVYWLTACNFLVILELPHYAILFWSLWGIALAFSRQLKQGQHV